jgi:hypothetical protein
MVPLGNFSLPSPPRSAKDTLLPTLAAIPSVIMKAVIYVTSDKRCHNVPRNRQSQPLPPLCTEKPITAGVVAFQPRVQSDKEGQCRLLDEFNQFLPFGLTLSPSPPTVTVRNRYRKRRLAGKPRKNAI